MYDSIMRGGSVKGKPVKTREIEDAGPRKTGGGFIRSATEKASMKPPETEQPEGWNLGPIAKIGLRRLRESGLKGRKF
jgi:hypothetical protein